MNSPCCLGLIRKLRGSLRLVLLNPFEEVGLLEELSDFVLVGNSAEQLKILRCSLAWRLGPTLRGGAAAAIVDAMMPAANCKTDR